MHLKAYAVDGVLLRTGSANLSPSGLKQQDNDLIILRDPAAVAKFEARFDQVYAAAEPMRVGGESKSLPPVARLSHPRRLTRLVRSKATSTLRESASIISRVTKNTTALLWRTAITVCVLTVNAGSAQMQRLRRQDGGMLSDNLGGVERNFFHRLRLSLAEAGLGESLAG